MELSIEKFMKALKDELDKQEIFLSECDFQLNLAKKCLLKALIPG